MAGLEQLTYRGSHTTPIYEGLVPCPHRTVDDGGRILCGLIKGGDREVSVNLCRACPVPQINCQHLRASMRKNVSSPITVRFATGRVEVWDDEAPTIGFKQAACAVKTMPINSPRDCTGCPLRAPNVIPQTAIQIARRARGELPAVSPPPVVPVMAAKALTAVTPRHVAAEKSEHIRSEAVGDQSDLVRHARAIAERNSRDRTQENVPARAPRSQVRHTAEPVSKIILLQQWLADQIGKKSSGQARAAAAPDEDGVQDIVYSPMTPGYQEEPGYERCVGWTD